MSITFLLFVLENLKKYHKGDFAGHYNSILYICIIKIIIYNNNIPPSVSEKFPRLFYMYA